MHNPCQHLVGRSLDEVEKHLLLATLQAHDWSRRRAAQVLGRSHKTIYNLIERYELRIPPPIQRRPAPAPGGAP